MIELRLAEREDPEDAEDCLRLLAEADAWARSQGLSQWHGQDLPKQISEFTRNGELFVYRDPETQRLLGMMVLQGSPDHYWDRPDDQQAIYVHKLVVDAKLRGTGLGLQMLQWGEVYARSRGRAFVRLDCLAANPKLRAYYQRHGYAPMGEVWSDAFQIRMALFEKKL